MNHKQKLMPERFIIKYCEDRNWKRSSLTMEQISEMRESFEANQKRKRVNSSADYWKKKNERKNRSKK